MGSVELGPYVDDDGGAEPDSMLAIDGMLWVALHRYDFNTYLSEPNSWVLGIDCATDDIVVSHPVGASPSLRAIPTQSDAVLVQMGAWGDPDGRIVTLNLADGTMVDAAMAQDFGGPLNPEGWTPFAGGLALSTAVYGDGTPENPDTNSLHCVDPTGVVTSGTTGVTSYLAAMTLVGWDAWVMLTPTWSDPALPHGVAKLNPKDCTIDAADDWMTFSLPPTSIAVLD